MITLAIDTSDSRGSVAVLLNEQEAALKTHDDGSDYSAWLLPTVDVVLAAAKTKIENVDLLAVSTGPGSFTGLRVGLAAAKAWAEVYGRHLIGVSRLEALARSQDVTSTFVASCYNAQREQIFCGLYRGSSDGRQQVDQELVAAPTDFVAWVDQEAGNQPVAWVSLDPKLIENLDLLQRRLSAGDKLFSPSPTLASVVGKLALERAARNQFSDPVSLDANYVRRPDAEIFWKGGPAGVR